MLRTALLLAAFLFMGVPAMAGETVTYKDGDSTLEGYVATTAKPNAPVVLIVHQWKGLTDHEKSRADMLAADGYNAFAIDMYGQGIRPQTNEAAGAEAGKYKGDPALAHQRINAALAFARTLKNVDASKIAVMGFCFGGTMSLEAARMRAENVLAVVSFHGGLASKDPATKEGDIKASVMVHHGADDPLVPEAEVATFKSEMKTAKADLAFSEYAGAVHAFTQKEAGNDPTQGVAYNEKADKRSWAATLAFLAEKFGR